jgi:integrase
VFTKSKKTRTIQLDQRFFADLVDWARYTRPNERVFKNGINAFNVTVRRSTLRFPQGQMTHILRHTFASYFIMNGGSILSLKEILGHSDIKMTMKYVHLAPDRFNRCRQIEPPGHWRQNWRLNRQSPPITAIVLS